MDTSTIADCRIRTADCGEEGFPKGHRVKMFRLVISTNRTDYVATNDMIHDDTQAAQELCALEDRARAVHRELKKLTGVETCHVVCNAVNATISGMPCWFGFGSSKWLKKLARRSIN